MSLEQLRLVDNCSSSLDENDDENTKEPENLAEFRKEKIQFF